jgi:hypothetical protein
MKRLWTVVVALLVPAAFFVTSSGAVGQAPSGDTCSVTGSGTSYTVVINIPANGVEQGAFAFGAAGGTVTNIVSSATQGALSTTGVPANTTAAWIMPAAAVPGSSVSASVATSGPIKGAFTVVPGNRDHTAWFDPIVCQHPVGTPVPSNRFTVQKQLTYNAKTGVWREVVTVPGPGKLSYAHRTLAPKGTPTPLIWSGKVSTWKAGKVMLTLKPTPAGRAALAKSGTIRLNLNIQYSPNGGKPANKVVTLSLRK